MSNVPIKLYMSLDFIFEHKHCVCIEKIIVKKCSFGLQGHRLM